MDLSKFLDVRTLVSNPTAEAELERLRPMVATRIDASCEGIETSIDYIEQRWPQSTSIIRKMRPVFWDAVHLSDVVYRRVVALLNLTRHDRRLVGFEYAAQQILAQSPARDVPEQASFLSFIDRLHTLWCTLRDAEYYRDDEDDRFSTDALLPIRPLHAGTNAMNANYVAGKRHYLRADEERTIRMLCNGRRSSTRVQIEPAGSDATRLRWENRTLLLDEQSPSAVVGRPLQLHELFRFQLIDEDFHDATLSFPVDAVIRQDRAFSRGAIRVTRLLDEFGDAQVVISENGTFHDVDLGDRRYVSEPDEQTGLHGFTLFGPIPNLDQLRAAAEARDVDDQVEAAGEDAIADDEPPPDDGEEESSGSGSGSGSGSFRR